METKGSDFGGGFSLFGPVFVKICSGKKGCGLHAKKNMHLQSGLWLKAKLRMGDTSFGKGAESVTFC